MRTIEPTGQFRRDHTREAKGSVQICCVYLQPCFLQHPSLLCNHNAPACPVTGRGGPRVPSRDRLGRSTPGPQDDPGAGHRFGSSIPRLATRNSPQTSRFSAHSSWQYPGPRTRIICQRAHIPCQQPANIRPGPHCLPTAVGGRKGGWQEAPRTSPRPGYGRDKGGEGPGRQPATRRRRRRGGRHPAYDAGRPWPACSRA